MLNLLVILLSVLMFLDCVILICLVLLQLPKKEAGAGLAFGAAATDALFGAGSGNVLTKITKYVAGAFFGLALVMAMLSSHMNNETAGAALIKALGQGSSGSIPVSSSSAAAPATTPAPAPTTAPKSTPAAGATPFLQLTNAPATSK
ncbi:MAG TPA: preprotein translocase subunit SecG [Verrucomicrobiae bacterium]|jgi:preprotein translocase subunit SecG|nr:preprotein translocase subunit SecG [Verrucomicrobiae bacterium]